jgi:hypothetical protein
LFSSLASILLPFGLAIATAPLFHARFSQNGIGRIPFSLFLGVSMSITAFPVLARILEERNLQTSSLGATALLCAAVDDVIAWMLLAVAMTFIASNSDGSGLYLRFLWLGAHVAVMFFIVRPLGRWLAARKSSDPLSYELLGALVAVALASSAVTDAVGVHPLFGAFLAGLCFPRVPAWQQTLRNRLETILSLVLLPLFFALTGLRTRLDLLGDTRTWLWTAFILLLAIAGKMGGAVFGARLTGQNWKTSLALWRSTEYTRSCGTDRAQHCLQRACLLANAFHDACCDGPGDDRHNSPNHRVPETSQRTIDHKCVFGWRIRGKMIQQWASRLYSYRLIHTSNRGRKTGCASPATVASTVGTADSSKQRICVALVSQQ